MPSGYHWLNVPELSDEFSGNELDNAKWQPTTSIWNGRRPSRFSTANVSVSGLENAARFSTQAMIEGYLRCYRAAVLQPVFSANADSTVDESPAERRGR